MWRTVRPIVRNIVYSKHIYPIFRTFYYAQHRLRGGVGGWHAQKYLKQMNKTEFADLNRLEQVQREKLAALMNEVYENVPYYKRIMHERKLKPTDIRSRKDLVRLPVLTKQDIRDNFEQLLNRRYRKNHKLFLIETGGTTGTPLRFYFSNHEMSVRAAHWERWKQFAGVKQFDKMMYIGIDGLAKNNPDYKGRITKTNILQMASFLVDGGTLDSYWELIRKFKPVYLRGYASACYMLAEYLIRKGIKYPLKAVLTSSDMLYAYQKPIIREVFGCEIFDHYGQVEDIVTATECHLHDGFHVNMETSIVEIISSDERELDYGERGRIIGTHLENHCMPLLRYDIGDEGILTCEKCKCGRNHIRIKKLCGRNDDWICTPDGKRVGVQINQTMEPLYKEIIETQFIQEDATTLIVRYVPTEKWHENVEAKFEKEIRGHVGNAIRIEFQKVSRIEKTRGGKHRLIISKPGDMARQ